jgi:Icc-related predicted phosphoesterase
MVTIAAAGDVHASEVTRERIAESFEALEPQVDLVLLAGDLTTLGEPEQAEVLADACRDLHVPVCAVLGNHDLHSGHGDEIAAILKNAGLHMLDRSSTTFELDGGEVGVVGTKGFIGGFTGSALPDFGEPTLRQVYAEEPEGIWTYLGCDRLATPIAEYRPDVVLHGHAHGGSFEGAIGTVPVYNVAVHVTGKDFYVFELEGHEVEVETLA